MAGSISATTAALIAAGVGAAGTAATLGYDASKSGSSGPTAAEQAQLAAQQQLAAQKAKFLTSQAAAQTGSQPVTGLTTNPALTNPSTGSGGSTPDLASLMKLLSPGGGTNGVQISGGSGSGLPGGTSTTNGLTDLNFV